MRRRTTRDAQKAYRAAVGIDDNGASVDDAKDVSTAAHMFGCWETLYVIKKAMEDAGYKGPEDRAKLVEATEALTEFAEGPEHPQGPKTFNGKIHQCFRHPEHLQGRGRQAQGRAQDQDRGRALRAGRRLHDPAAVSFDLKKGTENVYTFSVPFTEHCHGQGSRLHDEARAGARDAFMAAAKRADRPARRSCANSCAISSQQRPESMSSSCGARSSKPRRYCRRAGRSRRRSRSRRCGKRVAELERKAARRLREGQHGRPTPSADRGEIIELYLAGQSCRCRANRSSCSKKPLVVSSEFPLSARPGAIPGTREADPASKLPDRLSDDPRRRYRILSRRSHLPPVAARSRTRD